MKKTSMAYTFFPLLHNRNFRKLAYWAFVIFTVVFLGFSIYFFVAERNGDLTNRAQPCFGGFSCPFGLFYRDEHSSFPGFTLINPRRGRMIYLVNWKGELVHFWKLPGLPSEQDLSKNYKLIGYGTAQAKLLPNGHLLVGHGGTEALRAQERPIAGKPFGSSIVAIKELDWDGHVVWEYKNEWMHHDFEPLPDGRIAFIEWEKLSREFAAKIKGGLPGSEFQGDTYSDAIVEVDRGGHEVWRWAAKDHLNPQAFENRIPTGQSRAAWTNIDNIVYVKENPINGKPAYLISINYLDSAALVDRESGEILWRWGSGFLGGQHSVDYTTDGEIVLFDTGAYRDHFEQSRGIRPGTYTVPWSRVLRVDPRRNAVTFNFSLHPLILLRAVFNTPINGGVQALPNGNILVSAGIKGRIFELNPETNRVVWDFMSPYGISFDEWPTVVENSLFSSFRYPRDYIAQFSDLPFE